MNNISWNKLVKNHVRSVVFGFFKDCRFNTFLDIPGEGCLSTIEAYQQKAILKRTTILWAEKYRKISSNIDDTLSVFGFKDKISYIGDVVKFYPGNTPIDLVNLDTMGQFTPELALYIRDGITFSDGAGFSITVHHHGTRRMSNFLEAANRFFYEKKFTTECFSGKTVKLKPHQFPGIIDDPVEIRWHDKNVGAIYGLLKLISFQEYNFNLETIIIYGEKPQENNMVTYVFSNITRKPQTGIRNIAARKAASTKVLNTIRKLM